jgi:hypothetical protein
LYVSKLPKLPVFGFVSNEHNKMLGRWQDHRIREIMPRALPTTVLPDHIKGFILETKFAIIDHSAFAEELDSSLGGNNVK